MRRLRPLAAAALALIAVTGVGCSNADTSTSGGNATKNAGTADSAGTTTNANLTAREKAVKFSECVRAHGVRDFPDPNAKNDYDYGVSVSPEVWTKAVDACKALQPAGTLSAKRTAKQQSATIKLAECVRANGVKDFPDPVNGEPVVDTRKIPSSNAPGGMTILNAALEKCRGLMTKVLDGP